MQIKDKVFVVTGGGNGIGREVVLELIRRGGRVAAVDLSEAGLAETVALAKAPEGWLTTHALSVSDRAAVEALPEQVVAAIIDLVRPWIDGDPSTAIVGQSLHRWKFAAPTTIIPAPLVAAVRSPPIVCCGDAFGGPKVEGAALSGLAAGRWVGGPA